MATELLPGEDWAGDGKNQVSLEQLGLVGQK